MAASGNELVRRTKKLIARWRDARIARSLEFHVLDLGVAPHDLESPDAEGSESEEQLAGI